MIIRVRRAVPEDVGPAAEVYLRSRHDSVPAVPPLVHDDEDVRRWFADEVYPNRELWVAVTESHGEVVGVMVLVGDRVDQLYVRPGSTGQGVGTQLIIAAQALRPDGLQLWTFASNRRAQAFYERHGFVGKERTDGRGNEERSPDIRYVWQPGAGP